MGESRGRIKSGKGVGLVAVEAASAAAAIPRRLMLRLGIE